MHIPWTDLTENGLNYLLNRCCGLDRQVLRQFPLSAPLMLADGRSARQHFFCRPAFAGRQNVRNIFNATKRKDDNLPAVIDNIPSPE